MVLTWKRKGGPSADGEYGAINRRDFLVALAAAGAAISLPDQATAEQVEHEWVRLGEQPWYFDVNEFGTIEEADVPEPELRSDLYNVSPLFLETPQGVVLEVESCQELVGHFTGLAEEELCEVQSLLYDEDLPGVERSRLERLEEILRNPDDWEGWVLHLGVAGLPRFRREIADWLAGPVDWAWQESWPGDWSGQGRAFEFFRDMDRSLVRELGIRVVEGDCPGSTYYAAEVRGGVEEANAAAIRLGLPLRFRTI